MVVQAETWNKLIHIIKKKNVCKNNVLNYSLTFSMIRLSICKALKRGTYMCMHAHKHVILKWVHIHWELTYKYSYGIKF